MRNLLALLAAVQEAWYRLSSLRERLREGGMSQTPPPPTTPRMSQTPPPATTLPHHKLIAYELCLSLVKLVAEGLSKLG